MMHYEKGSFFPVFFYITEWTVLIQVGAGGGLVFLKILNGVFGIECSLCLSKITQTIALLILLRAVAFMVLRAPILPAMLTYCAYVGHSPTKALKSLHIAPRVLVTCV